ncbi:hypothetical protein [Endozoicomonas euniceicola]|uniref:Uncharacterized protein n=1 Tax=Endozoicomonas euniceicola TaxID=1234143 RepID=A0ABY6GUG1_9GAMM|nr:hypothetical protein [Endozoicomonas euniceicola]UYM16029.1 hypothetical protein NX720_25030 [Endozoicomonas euniceicola]
MASKCLQCGNELPSFRAHNNPADNQLLCPDCYNPLSRQEQTRSGQSCACRGACNCATTRAPSASPWSSLPYFAIGTLGVAELLGGLGFDFSLLHFLPVCFVSWLAYTGFQEFYNGRSTPMESRNQARENMRRIDKEFDRRPNEEFNVLSDTSQAIFNKLTTLSTTGIFDFTQFLHLLHFTWLHFHLRNSESNRDNSLTSTLETVNQLTKLLSDNPQICEDQSFEECMSNQLLSQLEPPVNLIRTNNISTKLFYPPDFYFGSARVAKGNSLEEILPVANKIKSHFIIQVGSVGNAMFSLQSYENNTFDMFETSSGIYRNITVSDVLNRIYKLCKALGIYEVSVWIYTPSPV